MARDRQRAKQRQAARRAARLAERGERAAGTPPPGAGTAGDGRRRAAEAERADEEQLRDIAELEANAPPEDTGRSDTVLESPPPEPDFDVRDLEEEADEAAATVEDLEEPDRGRVKRQREETGERKRLIAFLVAVWAELQRVQWPDRRTLTQLTGVVLVFVLIVGGYLGGLDAIFSRLIKEIL